MSHYKTIAAVVAVAAPFVFGMVTAMQSRAQSQADSTSPVAPVYVVTSLKPNNSATGMAKLLFTPYGFTATTTLQMLIREAYGVQDNQIAGAPNWLDSEKYDIEARMEKSVAAELHKLSPDQRTLEQQRMLQALLADRFKLSLHRESKELPEYMLVIAKNGPKLQESKAGDTYPNGITGPGGLPLGPHMMRMGRGQLTGQALSMADLVRLLSRRLGRTVLDQTGLTANYDFTLRWTPDEIQGPTLAGTEGGQQGTDSAPSSESSASSIFTAIQDQLGLKLEPQRAPMEILVIDHAEMRSEWRRSMR
jgi:uncharacterized protein (TIGR03435 family)